MSDHSAEAQPSKQGIIIPPAEHPVREEDIDPEALGILYRLKEAGYAGYLVGGGVRDLYLGKKPKDFDISTNAHPGQLRKLFRNSRTIGKRFRLVQVFFRDNKIIEVSTLRSQSEYDEDGEPDQVLPTNNTFGTLEEDAFRRDLTINSLFYEVENKTVIDYVGGVQDLNDGIVRLIGDPDRRIIRDPVRMLRAVRHAARAGFTIEAATWEAIIRHRDKIELCPTSRIRDELLKDLQSGKSLAWAEFALQSGIFSVLFPFYEELLEGEEGMEVKAELLSLLSVTDRICSEGGKLGKVLFDDALLFALLLYPWAKRRFGMPQQDAKAARQLAQAVRDGLDEAFSTRLNLPRATLDTITILFVNGSVFLECARSGSWPAWLKKKSYFAACSRFGICLREAEDGEPADLSHFVKVLPPSNRPAPEQRATAVLINPERGGNGSSGGSGYNPAFSSSPEGIFGLRREGLNVRLL
ncbi:MAG: poly(A) polymerase [Candidatus Electronema aureum]|uniref:Poly(A) polymerase n=1 Tax=Candidatus Electronema aureum TaxID=2005002 RepID=A0A521G5D3_9BACT|nr:MAG: poly(A) polymerase [Candidatus Electronema aureum]